uniref:Uncharacterized protein n=1 Tax=Oryza glaberrima TaxID=4538 RepID=I1R6Y1_ORYGL
MSTVYCKEPGYYGFARFIGGCLWTIGDCSVGPLSFGPQGLLHCVCFAGTARLDNHHACTGYGHRPLLVGAWAAIGPLPMTCGPLSHFVLLSPWTGSMFLLPRFFSLGG